MLEGTLGETPVETVAVSGSELLLDVADVEPTSHDLSLSLYQFTLGEMPLMVLEPPQVADPEAVVDEVTAQVEETLDSFTAVAGASQENVAAARAVVETLRSWFRAASAEDRLELARFIRANRADSAGTAAAAPAAEASSEGIFQGWRPGEESDLSNALSLYFEHLGFVRWLGDDATTRPPAASIVGSWPPWHPPCWRSSSG